MPIVYPARAYAWYIKAEYQAKAYGKESSPLTVELIVQAANVNNAIVAICEWLEEHHLAYKGTVVITDIARRLEINLIHKED